MKERVRGDGDEDGKGKKSRRENLREGAAR